MHNSLTSRSTLLAAVLLQLTTVVLAQPPTNWTATPFNPPSNPLAVKSPYLNAWAPLAGGSAALNQAWPRSYDPLGNILEWYASIRVDGAAYSLLGQASVPGVTPASQKSLIFTPTQSSYLFDCGGKVSANVTFVTPIEPTDLVSLSLPFSYLQISATPSDGNAHSIQIYSDISGAWVVSDITIPVNRAILERTDTVSIQMQPVNLQPLTEAANRPHDATVYYSTKKTSGVTWQIGPSQDTRAAFANGTTLSNSAVPGVLPVGPPSSTNIIGGLAIDIGNVQPQQSGTGVFALGLVRDPIIQYTTGDGKTQNRTGYYWSQLSDIDAVISNVLSNYTSLLASTSALDASLANAASPFGSDYANLIALSTRQAFGALEYTIPRDPFNASDVKVFMKDMGYLSTGVPAIDVGNPPPGVVNPVDVIYAAMPAYLWLNPRILGYILAPLLDSQGGGNPANDFAAQNIGEAWPLANGNSKPHNEGIEQSANMLIMCLAHAQATGDTSLLVQYYPLLKSWADYLVTNTLNTRQQTTGLSDLIGNPTLVQAVNQTNLALKGVLGIGAMGAIAGAAGNAGDATHYNSTASLYSVEWASLALAGSVVSDAFGTDDPGFLYNLFADKLLGLDLVSDDVYNAQTAAFKLEGGQSGHLQYGIPLESSSTAARADWMLFAASTTTNPSVRAAMIKQVAASNSQSFIGTNNYPFTVVYNASTGAQGDVSRGSPAVGAMFAPLALTLPRNDISTLKNGDGGSGGGGGDGSGSGDDNGGTKHPPVGAIVGGIVGGVLLLLGALALFFFLRRRRQHQSTTRRVSLDLTGGTREHEPLSPSYPDMREFRPVTAVYHDAAPTPFPEAEIARPMLMKGASSIISGSSGVASSTATSGDATQTGEIMSEMGRLRAEMERIREEIVQAPPPRYDEGG